MAVLSVDRKWSGRRGGVSTDNRRQFGLRQGDVYQVVVDPETTIFDILIDPRLPKAGDLVPGTSTVWVRDVDAQQKSPIYWEVTAKWSGDVGPDDPTDSPLNQPPEVEWTDVETSEEADEDFDGNPIVTVNGEPISGVTMPVVDQVVAIKRNVATINTYAIGQYRRSVNSDTFLGWPPGTARLIKYSAKNQYDDELGFWTISARIQFRIPYRTTPDKAWYARVLHKGRLVRNSPSDAASDAILAVDGNQETVTEPVLLKADGTRETDPAAAHWLEFKRFNSLPFSALGLL